MSALVEEMTAATPGASDENRDAWLAERRSGITATEVRDLWLGKITPKQLAELKLGRRKDTFNGNAYTAWGKEREPVIAEQLRVEFDLQPESRVWHAAEDPRHLASPDGMGLGFEGLELSEIKTSGNDKSLYSPHFDEAGYLAQMVWQMYVMGAWRCLFAFEYRLGTPGGFYPGQLVTWYVKDGERVTAWVYLDEYRELLSKLIWIAEEFLALLDEMASEPFDEPELDDEIDTLGLNYLAAADAEKEAAEAKKAAYDALMRRIDGKEFLQESALARVSFTPAKESTEVVKGFDDEKARSVYRGTWDHLQEAQRAWDEVRAKFPTEETVARKSRATLRVTRGKAMRP